MISKDTYERLWEKNPKALAENAKKLRASRHDHKYEPGAYGVCGRCGDERKKHEESGTV